MSDESSSDYRGEERRESERTQGAFVVRMRFPRLEDFRYRYTRDLSRGTGTRFSSSEWRRS